MTADKLYSKRNSFFQVTPPDLFSYHFSILWNHLLRIGTTHHCLDSHISTSNVTVFEVLLDRSLPTNWYYRIIFSNVILPHQIYLELCQIGKAKYLREIGRQISNKIVWYTSVWARVQILKLMWFGCGAHWYSNLGRQIPGIPTTTELAVLIMQWAPETELKHLT